MKVLFIFALVVGAALTSPCTEIIPKKSDDCLSIYSTNSLCCMHKVTINGETKMSCEEKGIEFAGKQEYDESSFKGVKTKDYLVCNISVNLCGPITSKSTNKCLDAKLPNGLCCHDKRQGVCFSYPYHFKSATITCERTTEPEQPEKPQTPPKWSFWDDD